ncbi:hypothetical protein PCANC_20079 [Puccinia coronata f. sp. avenae]|uniref:dihydroneopterin aldolase n=1 Tax=Puccinia coronata f. sp. avenae TaxID=200324 RepID=A0A2N5U8T8_9BASI|nr:hypothetical protein PCANC_20079 [Puccinia coronata f. sp. avenae]
MSASPSPSRPGETHSIFIRSLMVLPRILSAETPGQNELHPAAVSLKLFPRGGFSSSIKHDRLDPDTLSYFDLSEEISSLINSNDTNSFASVHDLLSGIQTRIVLNIQKQQCSNPSNPAGLDSERTPPPDTHVDYNLTIDFSSLISLAKQLTVSRTSTIQLHTQIHIQQISIYTMIGILPHERTKKQSVLVSLMLSNCNTLPLDIQALTHSVYETVSQSSYQTVEALADAIATHTLAFQNNQVTNSINNVTVTVEKPQAVSYASSSIRKFPSAHLNKPFEPTGSRELCRTIQPTGYPDTSNYLYP